jgi:DNA-binding NtrC family response regulator
MRTAADIKKDVKGITPEAIEMLQRYPWPGNVRELQHVVERAVILSNETMLSPNAFDSVRYGLDGATSIVSPTPRSLPGIPKSTPLGGAAVATTGDGVWLESLNVNEAEALLIQRALQAAGNNRTKAAELLGISVRTLRNKLNGPGRSGDHDAIDDEADA